MIGIDLSEAMLARARRRRDAHGRDVPMAAMSVLGTGFADASFDAVVASFVFCVLRPDQQQPALAELGRIVRPGGEIRLLDYTLSRQPWRRFVMRLWAPWVRWAYGAGFDRAPERHIEPAGLTLVESRFLIDDIVRYVAARRPPGQLR